jgi:hypothetical protein
VRKRILRPASKDPSLLPGDDWLDLEHLARVELSSEDPAHPIEGALLPGGEPGWVSAEPGEQVLRIVFDQPQRVRRIWLRFEEPSIQRTQEYTLRWQPADGSALREIVRQQWTFSRAGATRETEDHRTDLAGVAVLELTIRPDIGGGDARASLSALRLA